MNSEEQFGRFGSAGFNLGEWAQLFRDALCKSALIAEGVISREKQLSAIIEVVKDIISLSACLPGLEEGVDPLDLVPLQTLLEALVDVQKGHQHMLLDATLSPHRHHTSKTNNEGQLTGVPGRLKLNTKAHRKRCLGVAFTRLLLDAGLKQSLAEQIVAELMTRAGFHGHRSDGISRATIHDWVLKLKSSGALPGDAALAKEYYILMRAQLGPASKLSSIKDFILLRCQLEAAKGA